MKTEKLQSFLLHKACLLLNWVGEGVKLDIPYKALLGTQKSEEERREMQYSSPDDCFRMPTLCLISSGCIISIIPTLVRLQLLLLYHPKENICLHEKRVQFPSVHFKVTKTVPFSQKTKQTATSLLRVKV